MKLKLNFNFLFFIIILGVISCSPKIKNETVKPETKINSSVQADVIVNAEKTSVDPKKELDNALLSRKIPVAPSFKYGVLDNGMNYFI